MKGQLLFLNRRGYHTSMLCTQCKEVVKCPYCDVSLAFHKEEQKLLCHTCGYFLRPIPHACLACNSAHLMQFRGVGTQQVERALHAVFPTIRTLRMDADTTRHKGSHQKILRAFGSGKDDKDQKDARKERLGTHLEDRGLNHWCPLRPFGPCRPYLHSSTVGSSSSTFF